MTDAVTWYDDIAAMRRDDRRLQAIVASVLDKLCPETRQRVRGLHFYPSLSCTYTLNKKRIFVCLYDAAGQPTTHTPTPLVYQKK